MATTKRRLADNAWVITRGLPVHGGSSGEVQRLMGRAYTETHLFEKGIDRSHSGYGDILTAKQRAQDWRKTAISAGYKKVGRVKRMRGGWGFVIYRRFGRAD